jgi:phage tail sheath protein FI
LQTPQTPGVYYERVDASAPAIAALRTDIAGFVGIAKRGPLHQALPVQSWRQFQAYYGDFTGAGYLAYAARGFFENGGQRCWIVRVGSEMANTAETVLRSLSSQAVWRISAFSPGAWGNDLELGVRETHHAQTLSDPLTSFPESAAVASVTGFRRGAHVRLSQGANAIYKVVSDVDAVDGRLFWLHPKSEMRLPYDSALDYALIGFDPNQPLLIESVEYTVSVRELGRLVQIYEGLSLVPEHPRYGPAVLAALAPPGFSGHFATLPAAPDPVVIQVPDEFELADWISLGLKPLAASPEQKIPLTGGADGLALLESFDFVGEDIDPLDTDEVKARKVRGLRALEEISEVSIIAVPDINIQPQATPLHIPPRQCIPDPCLPAGPPAPAIQVPAAGDLPPVFSESDIHKVQAALIQQCEKLRDRIALLDPPFAVARDDKLGIGAARAWRSRFDSKYAAFYYPWLRVVDPLRSTTSLTRDVPPCGHVAGQYAQTDFQFGVHKAPANAPLVWTEDVTIAVNDVVNGVLNPLGINAIRPLAGRGIRIFGARTVSSDSDWRFVNVRRLMMMIEKAIDRATQWAVFEPNDVHTRAKLNLSLTSFLLSLWQRGALIGAAANEAFFVKCDDEINPASERDQGRLLAIVGVAPSQPFEFIVLRVGRAHNQFEISEESSAASGVGVF